MKVKMIFATPVDSQDWLVGQVYDAPADVAERLIGAGRAEPAVRVPDAPVQAPAAEGGDPEQDEVTEKSGAAPKQSTGRAGRRGRK